METEITKMVHEFVGELLQVVKRGIVKDLTGTSNCGTGGKPRGMAALSAEERSVVALKAAATRKRRAAARKAVKTRKRNGR